MANNKKASGLGRDFYAIYSDNNIMEQKKGAAEMISVSVIDPRHDQPRKNFEREALQSLADSIATHGVLQPIIVRENPNAEGTYEIIAGERRWRAAKMAGLSEIPAVVFDGDELRAAQVAMIENIQREDLNPVEEALGYGALIDRFGLTQDQLAKEVGKSRSAITNMLRLLDLPEEVLALLRSGDLKEGHARALLGLDEEANMILLANRTVASGLSVREVEAAVRRMNALADKAEAELADPVSTQVRLHMKELEKKAMSTLGRRVRISRSTHKKVVELTYDDDADLEALLLSLCGENIFND